MLNSSFLNEIVGKIASSISSVQCFIHQNKSIHIIHATLLGLKKYRMMNSSSSSLVTFPLRFLSTICTYEAISVAVGWKLLFIAR